MKNKQYLLTLIFIVFIISGIGCKSKNKSYENNYSLIPSIEDSIAIELDKYSINLSHHIQYFQIDNIDLLATLNNLNNSINIYDLNKQKIYKTIKLPKEGVNSFNNINSFIFNGFDSILLFSLQPSLIGIIDTSGRLKKTFKHDTYKSTFQKGQSPIKSGNKIYLCQIYPAMESNGRLSTTGQKNSYINITVDLSSGFNQKSALTYPKDLIGKDVFVMSVERVLGFNNSFVYHFGFSDNLYITNNHVEFNKILLETNYKLNTTYESNPNAPLNKGLQKMLEYDQIKCIYYDKFRECYYLTIRKRQAKQNKKSAININFLYPECFILILDKNLKYMGEVHFPENKYSFQMCFITEKGLYISEDNVNNSEFNENYMRFKLFKLIMLN